MSKWVIEWTYEFLRDTPSDINEHLEVLYELAKECDSVTEFWVRNVVSTYALLHWCDNVISYDIIKQPEVEIIERQANNEWKNFLFVLWNTMEVDIEETDLLFIDTWHVYNLLSVELELHWNKAKKYLAFHDTTTFGRIWEDGGEWLLKAIIEFLNKNKHWTVKHQYHNNNWLLILERK